MLWIPPETRPDPEPRLITHDEQQHSRDRRALGIIETPVDMRSRRSAALRLRDAGLRVWGSDAPCDMKCDVILCLMTRRPLRWVLVATLATACVPAPAVAQGGPPLITDDPDTPGPGYWEINLAALLEKTRTQRHVEVPRVDLNYGVGRRIQVKFEMPWVALLDKEQRTETGAGNATVGVKWRFVGQEGERIAWSIYPQLDFNTAHSSVTKGIVEEGPQFLMPTEITVEMFHVEINGEVGRTFVENGPGSWIFGLSAEGHVQPRLELLAELRGG